MRQMGRCVCAALAIAALLSVPVAHAADLRVTGRLNVSSLTEKPGKTLKTLMRRYPERSLWKGYFGGGKQCYGFARLIARELTGSYPYGISYYKEREVGDQGWYCYRGKDAQAAVMGGNDSVPGVQVGDYIRLYSPSSSGHSVLVVDVDEDNIYVAECMGSSRIVHWYTKYTREEIKRRVFKKGQRHKFGVLINPINQ